MFHIQLSHSSVIILITGIGDNDDICPSDFVVDGPLAFDVFDLAFDVFDLTFDVFHITICVLECTRIRCFQLNYCLQHSM